MNKSEEVGAAIRTVGRAIERAQARRAAAGEVAEEDVAQGVLDTIEYLAERVKGRREAEAQAAVAVPPELVQPLAEWHGLVPGRSPAPARGRVTVGKLNTGRQGALPPRRFEVYLTAVGYQHPRRPWAASLAPAEGGKMEKKQPTPEPKAAIKEGYNEPLLIKHERLRDVTGFKYGEKVGPEMSS